MIMCIAYDWYTGWKGWSVQIVLPLTVVGMNLLYFILGFVDRKHQTDYGIYFFADYYSNSSCCKYLSVLELCITQCL